MFLLASASPRRKQLLTQAGIAPDEIFAPSIDETPRKGELPVPYAKRMAQEKAAAISTKHNEAVVLAADTVVYCGRRILPKAEEERTARKCLDILSGRRHRVTTAVCVRRGDKISTKCVTTQVLFKRLSARDITRYVASGEWRGKAGGYAIQGVAETFIPWINGSYANVVGLPLSETAAMLAAFGISPKE